MKNRIDYCNAAIREFSDLIFDEFNNVYFFSVGPEYGIELRSKSLKKEIRITFSYYVNNSNWMIEIYNHKSLFPFNKKAINIVLNERYEKDEDFVKIPKIIDDNNISTVFGMLSDFLVDNVRILEKP
ncbi:MAG: hypothetical protein IPJ79_07500 [Bacteroidetes bacterium]|nr:hypothetical protein [Bacteroidota bacterium]HNR19273.1 hypothetical protein [Bacteroidia bacterium]HNU32828.1 hypothetical protein [Bacteroidia bacterium]